jgi:hypothetical protein
MVNEQFERYFVPATVQVGVTRGRGAPVGVDVGACWPSWCGVDVGAVGEVGVHIILLLSSTPLPLPFPPPPGGTT